MKVETKYNVGDVVYGAWLETGKRWVITGPLTITESHISAKHTATGEKADISYKMKDLGSALWQSQVFATLNEAIGWATTQEKA